MTFKVKAEKCDTCIFRPGNVMHLEAGRVREMTREAQADDSFIICHDTLEDEDSHAMCRGYIEAGNVPQMYRIAQRLGMLQEVS